MRADLAVFEGDAFGDAFSDAFCDALKPHHPPARGSPANRRLPRPAKVRQIGVPATFPCAFASRAAARRIRRCSGGPLCRPFCRLFCDPICGPSRTDHPLAQNSPETDAFQRDRRIRQRGVGRGSRRARGLSYATSSRGRCTSEGSGGTFLSWNASNSPVSPEGATRTAAQPHTRGPRRRLRKRSSGRWPR